ncbi:PfkB family carbohydrate kinase [Mycolicibacillus trivialis]|uniref:D-beta-D-heptose 1-phosphate adenosyltransferase n=1 Tax=Mycolicibacillus trivialis TaxID=1798 RepID=A0A1X2EKR0_9MYCO|nr:PfkB family carbohydrate kinase [Mycolicibacillus trivialis]ORX05545.1 D-beta-D-heptose 1-phosphate adenosyltransferase [Mycolicibacillus trivialis]
MKPLVIIGDSMLDVDVDGSAERLSPEAPVPVVEPHHIWQRPGGAGLAAVLADRVHSEVVLVTATGRDASGRTLARLFAEDYPNIRLVETGLAGTTASKIRIRAGGQSVLRVDHGDGYAATGPLPPQVTEVLREAGAICVADYGRGVTAHERLRALLTAAVADIPVVWDPHPRGTAPVPGCALVTPNQSEARRFVPDTPGGQLPAALRDRWAADAVSVTLGARGALFADRRHTAHHLRPPDSVAGGAADTCGAGDRYSVAAAAELAGGADPLQAATAAVDDAARFVAAGGASAVSSVFPMLGGIETTTDAGAVTGISAVNALVRRVRQSRGTVVATGGCFDLLHTGHVRLLRRARELGDALIVLINSDESVRRLKGEGRPVVSAQDRARVLAALACVDGVVIFNDTDPTAMLDRLRPDIWVKGGDYRDVDLPEGPTISRNGGDVVLLPTVPGYSTSKLIAAAK